MKIATMCTKKCVALLLLLLLSPPQSHMHMRVTHPHAAASPAIMLPVKASMDCRLGDTQVTAPAAVGLKRRYLKMPVAGKDTQEREG